MRPARRPLLWCLLALTLAVLQFGLRLPGGPLSLTLAPYLQPVARVLSGFGETLASFSGWHSARQIAELHKQVAALENRERERQATQAENARLRRMLGMRKAAFSRALTAGVSGRSLADWSTHVVVDRGRADGVSEDMVAICDTGLVGRVVEMAEHSCRIRFFTASEATVPAVLGKSGAVGMLYGTGGSCEMRFVGSQVEVEVGETVTTSGQGQVYPGGLAVGRVVRNQGKADALYQTLDVSPTTDFATLQEVLLLARDPDDLGAPHSLDSEDDGNHARSPR